MKKLFINFLLLLFAFPSVGQITDFNFLYYTKDQGLPDNRIYDFQEDLKGRIWITTQTGVVCFDGKIFKNYGHPFFDSEVWENWGIHFLTMDDCGRIWEATSQQLFYFDEEVGKFSEYDLSGVEPEANKSTWASKIYLQDWKDDRSIWFRKGTGIYAIDCGNMVCRLKMKISLKYRSVWGVLGKDLEGNIAVGGAVNGAITFFRPDGSNYTAANNPTMTVMPKTDTFDYRLRTGLVMSTSVFQQPGTDQIWVSGEQLMSYEKNTGRWEKWSIGNTGVANFAGITTVPMLTGDTVLWMFSHYKTIITCFNTVQKKFVMAFQTEQLDNNGLRCGLMHVIYVDSKSNIWLGGNSGVSVILSDREQFAKYYNICPKGTVLGQISTKYSPAPYAGGTWKMPDGSLAEWVADRDKVYYIALSDHSKAYFDGRRIGDLITGQCKFINVQTGLRTIKHLNYLKNDQDVWVESDSKFSNTKDQLLTYWPATNDKIKIPRGDKFEIEKDVSGSWYGDGILSYFFQDSDFVVFAHPTHIFHGKRVKSNLLEGIQVRWWGGCRTEMSTYNAIFTTDSMLSFYQALDNNCDLKKGETGEGVIKRESWVPGKDSIFIHTFRIFDKIQPLKPADYQQKTFELDYSQNFISFEFDCANPTYSLLWYKLDGFDQEWFQTRSNKFANYTNLDGGHYTFTVKAQDEKGLEMGPMATFRLYVIPPYYRTWWFYGLCLGATGLIFYGIFRYREIQRLRQEQLRLHIARDLHDEVGSTLSSISILSESALLGVQKDLDQARFGNIGDKARAALDSISDIVWSINPKNVSMDMVLARMSAYASEMLESVGTVLHFKIGDEVDTLTLPMAKRKDFYLLFKEAIHNCVKHAHARQVEVKLEKQGNTLNLSVKDDGIGFDMENAKPGTLGGNGLQNMQSRAKVMGGVLKINSTPGAGTELQLTIPLST